MNVVVLASGRGSNLRAVLEAVEAGRCGVSVTAVVSDRESAAALELAQARGIDTRVVSPKGYRDRAAWDEALAHLVLSFEPRLVVLAGFMRIVGPSMLAAFPGRIINVHPALLPAFPGMDAPLQAVRARVSLSGCTVHIVDAGVDTGPILAQAAVPILPDDDAESLHARIQRAEHRLLPGVLDAIARGLFELGDTPRFVGPCSSDDAMLAWPPVLPSAP